jgi:hypothetical protein
VSQISRTDLGCIGENASTGERIGGSDVKRSEIVAAMRRAASDAEAGLYGQSEEVAAYQCV